MNEYSVNCHSSIRVFSLNKTVYFDPYNIEKQTNDADVIFITHPHYDHFSPDDIEKIRNDKTVVVFPQSALKDIKNAGFAKDRMLPVSLDECSNVCGFSFSCVPAYNLNKKFHPKSNGWLGYVVNFGEERVYVAGDTDALSENAGIKCDVAFVPVGGTYTMDYNEAAAFVNALKPKIAVPTHYGSIVGKKSDGESFKANINKDIQVEILIK